MLCRPFDSTRSKLRIPYRPCQLPPYRKTGKDMHRFLRLILGPVSNVGSHLYFDPCLDSAAGAVRVPDYVLDDDEELADAEEVQDYFAKFDGYFVTRRKPLVG